MREAFRRVAADAAEIATARAGDDLVAPAEVIMDRAFTVPGSPATVWPWLVQLGKGRAGWYLPARVERWMPPSRRALREIDPRFTSLAVGDVVPDYGGADATFEVARLEAPGALVYRSRRGRTELSWSLTLAAVGPPSTRVFLRLRLAPVRHRWLARTAGELLDLLTVAGLAAGLTERLERPGAAPLR